jgi:hypothetical protein
MTITADMIRDELLASEQDHALPLWMAMYRRSILDDAYRSLFDRWLQKGSTPILRDDLAWPFRNRNDLFTGQRRNYPWMDAWTAIDTAHLRVSRADREKGIECYPKLSAEVMHVKTQINGVAAQAGSIRDGRWIAVRREIERLDGPLDQLDCWRHLGNVLWGKAG